jgi:hypothetical protein
MVFIFIIHSLSIFKLIHTWNESHKTCIEETFLFILYKPVLIKFRSLTCSSLLIYCGVGDLRKAHYWSHVKKKKKQQKVTFCHEYNFKTAHLDSIKHYPLCLQCILL